MFERVDVAAISFVPEKFQLQSNADKLEQMFRKAAAGGARLAVAPEGIIEGYVVNEIIKGEVPAARMADVALTLRSRTIGRFRDLARELDMCLAFGFAERIGRDVFNCAAFVDQKGRLCGKYHKMQLAEGSHRGWWFNRLGRKSRAFNTPFGRCGFLICNDRWNEDIARIPVLDGARYLLIPSFGDMSKRQDQAVLARARKNGVPIVEANVGVTLIISRGEIVGVSRQMEKVNFATIEIPAAASPANRDRHERSFLSWRRVEMPRRYKVREQVRKKGKPRSRRSLRHDPKGAPI